MNEKENCSITLKYGNGSDYDSGEYGQRSAGE
ncbi:Uncharacterised protein [uncultured Clostridium sp.]|nr:Uncharacterised protein [uncultured Clostridium sp.]